MPNRPHPRFAFDGRSFDAEGAGAAKPRDAENWIHRCRSDGFREDCCCEIPSDQNTAFTLPTKVVNDKGRYHSHPLCRAAMRSVPKARFREVGSDSFGRITRHSYKTRLWAARARSPVLGSCTQVTPRKLDRPVLRSSSRTALFQRLWPSSPPPQFCYHAKL
jgi:hypothetical protein